jgi:ATP-dependent helicase/nuclease subunit B
VERRRLGNGGDAVRQPHAAKGLGAEDWDAAEDLLASLAAALEPLADLRGTGGRLPLDELVEAHERALLAVARPPEGGRDALLEGDAGGVLAEALDALRAAAPMGPEVRAGEYPALFDALIAGCTVRRRGGNDPRVLILGTLEARLQSFDTVVLGGLNEGTWPGDMRSDPFLSRPMRAVLALEPPERRIGLAAHDVCEGLAQPHVWLTRAVRQDGAPQVASRWLQRLTAYAGPAGRDALRARGADVLALAHALDESGASVRPAARPAPRPPVAHRPTRLSITEIETLIRDPYAVHARHVLKLRPFEPLASTPSAAERGTLIHGILERFLRERPEGPFDAAAHERLLAIGREAFAALSDIPEAEVLWWPRFERVAAWLIAEEAGRADVARRIVEAEGELALGCGVTLSGRADRIDVLADGRLRIVDYKTGRPPSESQVLSLSPQLLLEALMAEAGCFPGAGGAVAEVAYVRLSGLGEGGEVQTRGARKAAKGAPEATLQEALARTREQLDRLLAHFARAGTPYLSAKIPASARSFPGDYDHLARVAEWSTGGFE